MTLSPPGVVVDPVTSVSRLSSTPECGVVVGSKTWLSSVGFEALTMFPVVA